MSFEARWEISNAQVQSETSDRNATLLTSLINTIRSGIGLAGRFDGDVVGTGSLFKGGSSSKIDQPVDPSNQYTQRSFSCRAPAPRSKGAALKRPWSIFKVGFQERRSPACLTSTYFLASRGVRIQDRHERRLPVECR